MTAGDKNLIASSKGLTNTDKNLIASSKGLTNTDKNLVASGKRVTINDKNLVTTDKSFSAAFNDLANDHAAIQKIFSDLNLTQNDETISIKALTGGVSSNIFHITTKHAQYCLKQALPQLKVAKQWLAPVDRVFAEIAWLQTAAIIVPDAVPKILGIDQTSKSFVMQYLEDDYSNWKAELLAGRVADKVAAQLGNILGRIHSQTALNEDIAKRFANDETFYAIRLEPYLEEAARQHPGLSSQLKALIKRTQHNPKVLVHGDVSPKNIMLGPLGPVILDAECAWYGDPAFDVAFCLNHFFLKAAHMPQLAPALLQNSQEFLNAYLQEVTWEPVPELEYRIASLLPGLMLARVDGKSPVEYLAAERGAIVRTLAIEFLQQDNISFSIILERWGQEFTS
jgi:5-methylthioribose kinase